MGESLILTLAHDGGKARVHPVSARVDFEENMACAWGFSVRMMVDEVISAGGTICRVGDVVALGMPLTDLVGKDGMFTIEVQKGS